MRAFHDSVTNHYMLKIQEFSPTGKHHQRKGEEERALIIEFNRTGRKMNKL